MSMRYDEDLSLTEIAESLGITKQGVKSYIDGSLKKMRDIEKATRAYEKYRQAVEFLIKLKEGSDLSATVDKFLEHY